MDFAPVAERIVDALLEADPTSATFAGDHRFDDRLPDYSPDGIVAQVAMLRDASDTLAQTDIDALDAQEQVDHAVLRNRVESNLFELTEVRSHEWNPLVHNPGDALYELIAKPFAPAQERRELLNGRLSAIPDALAVARTVLRDCPRIHLETAAGQFAGTAALVRAEAGDLPAAPDAVAALAEFSSWLQVQDGERDPRLGRRLWEAQLWHTLDTELGANELLARAEANLDRVTEELRVAAAELTGGGSIREALDLLAEQRPDDATIVALAREALDDTTAFVREHDLVSLVDDGCDVQEMPEFARGIAVAHCNSPGPLETADVRTYFAIAPTPADWSEHRIESFYREYNDHMVRDLTVHEAMPGHYLQLAHSRRYRGRVRALAHSGTFIEGWAVYAEELMAEHGYGGLPVRLQQLKMQLRMTINTILDQLVHCDNLSEEDAMALLTGRGFQQEGEAAGKWRRALLTSTQLSTYFVGWSEVAAIAAARPADVSLRAWHDAMLRHGSPAPRHVRSLLVGD